MYSPKISEDLIPVLYHAARARRVPMTKLVDKLIRNVLGFWRLRAGNLRRSRESRGEPW